MPTDLSDHERQVRAAAADVLGALLLARRATEVLSSAIAGATIPAAPEPTPPSYYVRAATGLLAIIGLRTARACILVVESGYWPEAQALKRRLSEVHARAEAIGTDETGEHGRLWLEHKAPSVGKIIHKFGSVDAWSVYNWGAHADARSVHAWLSVEIEGRDDAQGILVLPEHDERLSNALLTEVAEECRDMAMAQSIVRSTTHAEIEAGRAPPLSSLPRPPPRSSPTTTTASSPNASPNTCRRVHAQARSIAAFHRSRSYPCAETSAA